MSGRIKSKVVNATLANKEIMDMFQGVLGGSDNSNLPITHAKYLRLREHVDRFLRLLVVLRDASIMARFPEMREHLTKYVAALQAQLAASFSAPDFTPHLPALAGVAAAAGGPAADYAGVPEAAVAEFEKVKDYAQGVDTYPPTLSPESSTDSHQHQQQHHQHHHNPPPPPRRRRRPHPFDA